MRWIVMLLVVCVMVACTPATDMILKSKPNGMVVIASQKPIGDQLGLIAQLKAQTSTIRLYPYLVTVAKDASTEFLVFVRNPKDSEAEYHISLACIDEQGYAENFQAPRKDVVLQPKEVSFTAMMITPTVMAKNEIFQCKVTASSEDTVWTDSLVIQVVPVTFK